jgi:hypothetical protein
MHICVCVLLGGDPGTPVEHEFSGLRRFWKVKRNGHTPHHPLSVPVELEVVPMTCWAVLVSNSARRSFLTQALRSRPNHSQNEPSRIRYRVAQLARGAAIESTEEQEGVSFSDCDRNITAIRYYTFLELDHASFHLHSFVVYLLSRILHAR